ncbi:hypothetical protein WICPIJ_007331 [Wickerhamomyces pijperi]|uniref:Uncharacterized protein n=1 Tax=Wickerhamomyces pijperi TaxID=599730 RepID=A0A9P8Q2Q0_WICPI|nr:hypothetical protein WICPIJ_007331 [Wickerhamomyces pijperi]
MISCSLNSLEILIIIPLEPKEICLASSSLSAMASSAFLVASLDSIIALLATSSVCKPSYNLWMATFKAASSLEAPPPMAILEIKPSTNLRDLVNSGLSTLLFGSA